jgi:hypothetical protein
VAKIRVKPAAASARPPERRADRLGINGVTALAVRPDRFVGFRHDGSDPLAVQAYLEMLTA